MCRLSTEMFAAAGGGTALATLATFAKVHWDALRDRRAFKDAETGQNQKQMPSEESTEHADVASAAIHVDRS